MTAHIGFSDNFSVVILFICKCVMSLSSSFTKHSQLIKKISEELSIEHI